MTTDAIEFEKKYPLEHPPHVDAAPAPKNPNFNIRVLATWPFQDQKKNIA